MGHRELLVEGLGGHGGTIFRLLGILALDDDSVVHHSHLQVIWAEVLHVHHSLELPILLGDLESLGGIEILVDLAAADLAVHITALGPRPHIHLESCVVEFVEDRLDSLVEVIPGVCEEGVIEERFPLDHTECLAGGA